MVLSVADPDLNFIDKDQDSRQWGYSQPASITVTMRGRWKTDHGASAAVTYPEPEDTAITMGCQNGLTTSLHLTPVPN